MLVWCLVKLTLSCYRCERNRDREDVGTSASTPATSLLSPSGHRIRATSLHVTMYFPLILEVSPAFRCPHVLSHNMHTVDVERDEEGNIATVSSRN